jgi:hypothetical protein
MVSPAHTDIDIGARLVIERAERSGNCDVVRKPFHDPEKSIAAQTMVTSNERSDDACGLPTV